MELAEKWLRQVVKLMTQAGKAKVLGSLQVTMIQSLMKNTLDQVVNNQIS